jgi:flagellar hook-length control protein FliK
MAPPQEPPAPELEAQEEGDAPTVSAAVPPAGEPRHLPGSSWLLLALGQGMGPLGRTDHGDAVVSGEVDVEPEVEEDAFGVEAAAPIDPAAMMPAVVVPVTTLPLVAPPPEVPSSQVPLQSTGQGTTASGLVQGTPALGVATTLAAPPPSEAGHQSLEALVDRATTVASGAKVQAEGSSAIGLDTPLPVAAPSAEVTAEIAPETASPEPVAADVAATLTESTPRPAPDAIARWRAAARALAASSGPRIASAVPVAVGEASSETVSPAAPATTPAATPPGAAVKALAQMLGAGGQRADTSGQLVWTAPGAGVLPDAVPAEAVAPTTRAIDVLSRLAPPAAESQPEVVRAAEQSVASAFGSMLASSSSAPAVAPLSAPAPVAALPPAVGEQVNAHIVSSLKMQWRDGVGEAKLHLRPDALGSVTVALRVEHGAVTAVVRSDSPQVQEWVLQHQQTLRQQMESAGLRLDDLTVTPDDRDQQEQQEAPAEQRRRPRRGQAEDADAPVFELLA